MKQFDFDSNFNSVASKDGHCVIQEYISSFDSKEGIKESTMEYVFSSTSNRIQNVLTKVVVLNEFYSTQLNSNPPSEIAEDKTYHMDVVSMAKHILAWNEFDEHCRSDDLSKRIKAVNYIRRGESDYRKPYHKEAYSFATKYCSWHNPNGFPIVDSYSRGMLYYLNQQFKFYDKKLTQKTLFEDYSVFCEIYNALQKHLQDLKKPFSYRELDKFLWLYGKEHGITL